MTEDEVIIIDEDAPEIEEVEEEQAEEITAPSFEEEEGSQPGDDSGLVKHLRQQIKDRDEKLKAAEKFVPQEQPLRAKPSLYDDHNGDEDAYEADLLAYHDEKRQREQSQQQAEQARQQAQQTWEEKRQNHEKGLQSLGFDDADEANATVSSTLNKWQNEVLIKYTGNSAALAYALAKNPAKLAALASEGDVIEFGHAVKVLEGKMKMSKARAPLDKVPSGSNKLAAGSDEKLAKLEKQADETGDRTALIAYRKQLAKG